MRAIDCPCGHRLEGADDEEPQTWIEATRSCAIWSLPAPTTSRS